MRIASAVTLLIAVFAIVAGCGRDESAARQTHSVSHAPAAAEQTICPVMGGAVNTNMFADHDGRRVYFCCPSCIGEFKKAPEKYIRKMDEASAKTHAECAH